MNAQSDLKAPCSQKGFSVLEIAFSLMVIFVAVAAGMSVMASFNKGMLRTETQLYVTSLHDMVLKSSRSPASTVALRDKIEVDYPNLKACLENRGTSCSTLGILSLASIAGAYGVLNNFDRMGVTCTAGDTGCVGAQSLSMSPQCVTSTSCDSIKVVVGTKYAGVAGNLQYQSNVTYDPYSFGWVKAAGSCPVGKMLTGFDRSTGKALCSLNPGSKCEQVGWYAPASGVPGSDPCQEIAQAPQAIDRGIGDPTSLGLVGYRRVNAALIPPTIESFDGGIVQSCADLQFGYAYMTPGSSVTRTLTCPGVSTFRYRNSPATWGVWGVSLGWAGNQTPIGAEWGYARQMVQNSYYGGAWGSISMGIGEDCCTNMDEPAILTVIKNDSLRRYFRFDVLSRRLLAVEYRNIPQRDQFGFDIEYVDSAGVILHTVTRNMTEAEFVVSDISFKMLRVGEPVVLRSSASANHASRAVYLAGPNKFRISNFIRVDPNVAANTTDLAVGYGMRLDPSNNATLGVYSSTCNLVDSSTALRLGDWAEIQSDFSIEISFIPARGGLNYFDMGSLNCMNSGPVDPEAKSLRKHIVFDLLKRSVVRSVHVESSLNNWGYDIDLKGESGAILDTISGTYSNQEAFYNSVLSVSSERTSSGVVRGTSLRSALPSSVSMLSDRIYTISNYAFLSGEGSTTQDPTLATPYEYEILPDNTVNFYFRTNTGTRLPSSTSFPKDTWVKLSSDYTIRILNN